MWARLSALNVTSPSRRSSPSPTLFSAPRKLCWRGIVTYLQRIEEAKDRAVRFLKGKGVPDRYLQFDREGDRPARAPTVPTDLRSEFLANRAMGDWAEDVLSAA